MDVATNELIVIREAGDKMDVLARGSWSEINVPRVSDD